MPTNIIDVDEFTDPVTKPVGSDVRDAASFGDPLQKLANRTRWLKNLIEGYFETDVTLRQIRVGAHRARIENGTWVQALIESGISCTDDTGTGRRQIRFDVSAGVELPWKGTVTQVALQVRPGGARGDANNQMRAILMRVESNPETMAAVGSYVLAANNGDLQQIIITPATPISINGEATSGNNHRLLVLVETGVSSGAAVDDTVYDARFTTTTEVR